MVKDECCQLRSQSWGGARQGLAEVVAKSTAGDVLATEALDRDEERKVSRLGMSRRGGSN